MTATQDTILAAISVGDRAAIDGFRPAVGIGDNTLRFTVGGGYKVDVIYDEGSDTFVVQRLFVRGINVYVKGEVPYVHTDQLSEVVYRASCYHDSFGTEVPT